MPTVDRNGVSLYYECRGPTDAPAVVFVPTSGFGPWQLAWQYPAIQGQFRTVLYHPRGTGRSASSTKPYGIKTLAEDVEAILRAAEIKRAHAIGIGDGGLTALEYAYRYNRVRSLVVMGVPTGELTIAPPTAFHPAQSTSPRETLSQGFSQEFRQSQPDVLDGIIKWRDTEDAPASEWDYIEQAVTTYDRDWPVYELQQPTLVVHGGADDLIPPQNATTLATELPHGEAIVFDEAGHFVFIERSKPVNDRLLGVLDQRS